MSMEPMLDSYNDNSALQATCQRVGNPILASMATGYAEGRSESELKFVRIAEYGCSGGRNSYEPMRTVLSALRGESPHLRAECVLEDLPSNPWHLVMEEAPRLAAAFGGDVHTLCAGTSFYSQVCSDQSLNLGYSYVAVHFLSDTMPLASHILMHESAPEERAAWEAQAARDWENFLLLRARELKKGGRMMISTMSRDSYGYSWQRLSHLVWDSICHLCSKGALTKREAESLCIPACLRSEEEIMAPFTSNHLVGSSFEVNSLEFSETEVEGEKNLSASVLAKVIRRRVQAVWGGMFLTQLARLGRSASSARDVTGEIWDFFEEAISKNAAHGWLDMQSFYLEVTRK
jgi:hypothetical protein